MADDLTGSEISSTSSNDTSTLGQEHDLAGSEINSEVSFDTPIVGIVTDDLSIEDVSVPTEVENSTIGQIHELESEEIDSVVQCGEATLDATDDLVGSDISVTHYFGTPVLNQPLEILVLFSKIETQKTFYSKIETSVTLYSRV